MGFAASVTKSASMKMGGYNYGAFLLKLQKRFSSGKPMGSLFQPDIQALSGSFLVEGSALDLWMLGTGQKSKSAPGRELA